MAQATEKIKVIKLPAASIRTFEQVANHIRRNIASGVLKPGDKLAPERDMAKQFEVGRNAVREALRDLEGKGIVRLEKGRGGGTFVRPPNASRVTHALSDLVDGGSISLSDLTEARVLFMELVVQLASQRATESDFAALEKNIEETEEYTKAGNMELRIESIGKFYTLVAESTGNSVLVLMATSLSAIVRRLLDQAVDSPRRGLSTTIASRRRFLRFLRAGKVDKAIAELSDHLVTLHQTLVRFTDELRKNEAAAKRSSDRSGRKTQRSRS
jgi:GntR family transcriptional regulator, transcriptional repressor for pyruvate dehydrogenase complex